MNKTICSAFIALILVQITLNQGLVCPDGQVVNGAVSSTKCTTCPPHTKTCQTAATTTYHSRIVGFGNPTGAGNVPYCPGSFYNKNTNNCEQYCK